MPAITTEGLARETLALLKLQNEYFKRKNPDILRECKAAEKKLARICAEVIDPPLFSAESEQVERNPSGQPRREPGW